MRWWWRRRREREADLEREVRSHLDLEAEELADSGVAPEEARYAARRSFGNEALVKEDVRDVWRARALEQLLQDLRYALRTLRKSPGFLTVAVLTLALGIGANTTIFTVMNATLLKTLPFPEPDRLVLLWMMYGKGSDNYNIVSAPTFWDWQKQSHSFDRMAMFDSAGKGYNLSADRADQEALQVSGVRVTAGFFDVLGIRPLLGRGFLPEEEVRGKDHEVVLSYGLWKSRYGGDASLVGKTIKVDSDDYTVVGVMPQDFHFQFWSRERQLWVPAGYTTGDLVRGSNSFIAIGRLKPGVSISEADAELKTIQARIVKQFPKEQADTSAAVQSMADFGLRELRRVMFALLAAVGLVLLIACGNIANLLVARGAGRQKEFAIRRALGASRARLARQLLVESVVLSLIGGALGLALAIWTSSLLAHILPRGFSFLPFRPLAAVSVDGRVLAFTLLISTLTGVLFGLAPASSATGHDLNEPLKEGGRGSAQDGRSRMRHVLIACEVALAMVVLCGAGLMMQTMSKLLGVDPGFDPKNVLTLDISLPQVNTYYGPPVHARFCQQLQESVAALPGVVSVGAVAHLPMEGNAGRGFNIEGQPVPPPEQKPGASYSVACPGYFRTMRIPMIAGREFTDQDTVNAPQVIVINEAMAKKFWPNQDAIGKRISMDIKDPQEPWLTVVGVAGNVRHWGLDNDVQPQFFRPYTQAAWPWMSIVVRSKSNPMALLSPIKRAITQIEPEHPTSGVETLESIVSGSVGARRFPTLLLASFALLALVLAAVGIVGLVSYAVTQRTHEIGIRIALGARGGDVLALFVRRSMVWVFGGVVAGIVASLGVTQLVKSMLFGVRPTDPIVLSAAGALLVAIALLASYLPARRATKLDPLEALRCE